MKTKRCFVSALLLLSMAGGLLPTGMEVSAKAASNDYQRLATLCADTNYVGSIELQINNTDMKVDGENVEIDPQQGNTSPQIVQSRTMLPARALVETLGGTISYSAGKVSITASDDTQIELEKGSNTMTVDGEDIELDVAPVIINNRTFVPVRAVSESLGCDVEWDQETKTATITQPCQTCRLVVDAGDHTSLPQTNPTETIDLGDNSYIFLYDTVNETKEALETFESRGMDAYPDEPVEAEPQDFDTGWEDEHCGLSDYVALEGGSRPVTVAVVDSGLQPLSLFDGRVPAAYDVLTGRSGNISITDEFGHGTCVSSLIAQYTPKQVKILPIKIFNEHGSSPIYLSQWATILSFAKEYGADVMNMSLSYDKASFLDRQIQGIIQSGTAVVCSAGNIPENEKDENVKDTANYSPANLSEAIVVAATNQSDLPTDFSRHGTSVDLAAPGEDIRTLNPSGSVQVRKGTSFSAPLVTATAATMLSKQAYSSPAALENALKSQTTAFPAGTASGYGKGVLHLTAAKSAEPTITSYRYSQSSLSMKTGGTASLIVTAVYSNGTSKDVTSECGLSSSNTGVVTVNDGTLTALSAGTAKISMTTAASGVTKPTPVTVTVTDSTTSEPEPTSSEVTGYEYNISRVSILVGERYSSVKVYARKSDGTTEDVTGSCGLRSADESIATVDNNGNISAVKVGTTRISMGTVPDDLSLPTPINVTVFDSDSESDPVSEPEIVSFRYSTSSLNMQVNESTDITVTAVYDNGDEKDVTNNCGLYSSDSEVVSVSGGTVTARKAGSARISMSSVPDDLSLPRPIQVTVTASRTLVDTELNVPYNSLALNVGETFTLKMTAFYTDGSTEDMTEDCTFSSSKSDVASVSSSGVVTALKEGTSFVNVECTINRVHEIYPVSVVVSPVSDDDDSELDPGVTLSVSRTSARPWEFIMSSVGSWSVTSNVSWLTFESADSSGAAISGSTPARKLRVVIHSSKAESESDTATVYVRTGSAVIDLEVTTKGLTFDRNSSNIESYGD